MFIVATILAESGYKTFLTSFEDFIDVLLFFFVPWTVINLDRLLPRPKKGRYDVKSFFTHEGHLRRLAADRGRHRYVLALAVQVPFIDQTLYVGPLVKHARRRRHLLARRLRRGRGRLPGGSHRASPAASTRSRPTSPRERPPRNACAACPTGAAGAGGVRDARGLRDVTPRPPMDAQPCPPEQPPVS